MTVKKACRTALLKLPLLNKAYAKKSAKVSGLLRASAGVVTLSFGAALVRLAEVSAWNVAFWRGSLIAISLTGFLFFMGQLDKFAALRRYGYSALLVSVIYGVNTALFVFAVIHTKVANVMVILCSTPLFAAMFSWLMLREKLPLRSWLAIAVVIVGVLIVFGGSVSGNGWQGDLMAWTLAAFTAFLFTYLRRYPGLPRIPAVAIGGAFSALIVLPWATPLTIPVASIGWLALLGLLQKPLASIFMLTATRYTSSSEVSLFLLLEIVLAPFWVWIAVGESVPQWTWLGGSFVVMAVTVHGVLELREERQNKKQSEGRPALLPQARSSRG